MTDNSKTAINGNHRQQASPRGKQWLWLPTLLFGDGLTFAVILMAMVMLHRFGATQSETMLYVSLFCLPLVFRPLLEAVVTYFRGTTKVWILSAEFISALSLCALAFILPTGYWRQGTLCFIMFFVVSSEFSSIAVTRFYLTDALSKGFFVHGFSTLFRCLALVFGVGICATLAGNMEVITRDIRYSWSLATYVVAGVEFFLWLWHSVFLPGGRIVWSGRKDLSGVHFSDIKESIKSLLQAKRSRAMLIFFFLFALPEAILALMSPLFMVDAAHYGALGLAPQEFGLAFGTVGVTAFFFGEKLCQAVVRRFSLRQVMFPAAALMSLHGLTMLHLSYNPTAPFALISLASFVGYAALGIGAAPFSVVVRHYAAAADELLRRAVVFSIVSLTASLTAATVGVLQGGMGYRQFFGVATLLYIAPIAAAIWFFKISKDSADNAD